MSKPWPKVRLGEVLTPTERGETPMPGTTYRQVGVKLWGEGAYEREPIYGAEERQDQRAATPCRVDGVVVGLTLLLTPKDQRDPKGPKWVIRSRAGVGPSGWPRARAQRVLYRS